MEMLGDDKDRLAVKLGGIYALERVAKDSPEDHWTVMEVLCSYVQACRPIPEVEEGEEVPYAPVPKRIQAILTVLGRRDASVEKKGEFLELGFASLNRADFRKANLVATSFWGADLRTAQFASANLKNSLFVDADLRQANLQDADLQGANLEGAKLQGAKLQGTSGLTHFQIGPANGNSKTILPDYLTRPESWKDE